MFAGFEVASELDELNQWASRQAVAMKAAVPDVLLTGVLLPVAPVVDGPAMFSLFLTGRGVPDYSEKARGTTRL